MGQASHHLNDVEHYRSEVQEAIATRNWKYIEDEFPDDVDPDRVEGDMNERDCMWRYAACPFRPPCESCGRYECHPSQFVVAVDGGCRGYGTPTARAAVAVWFGPNNPLNFMGALDYDPDPTSQKAEIAAVIKALEIVRKNRYLYEELEPLKDIIIKTDSAYFVNSMTQYIHKWKTNGFRTSTGKPVANRELLVHLDNLVNQMKEEDSIGVFFWHVRREYNEQADRMVNVVLRNVIGRPKVYIVAPAIEQYPWFGESYAALIEFLDQRASVSIVTSTESLPLLVEGPNTSFLLIDEGVTLLEARQDMIDFARAVREHGSRVVVGGLLPTTAQWSNINALFNDVFNLPWQTASYTKDNLIPFINCQNLNTLGLLASECVKALFLKNVEITHKVYGARLDSAETFAACARIGLGFVSYIGDVNPGPLNFHAVVALLGLPAVNEEQPFRLLFAATRIKELYGGACIDASQLELNSSFGYVENSRQYEEYEDDLND